MDIPTVSDPAQPAQTKGAAVPLKRTKAQQQKIARDALGAAQAEAVEQAQTKAQESAQRLAQIVNLHIAGFSLADIGAQIGATADEVDRMLSQDATRYIRSQPALRTYVRNYISGKYTTLLESVWDAASDNTHRAQLENQDRAVRILDRMAKLHGADAPTQAEVKVEAAPEAVDKLVAAISANQGLGYDVDIFSTVPGEVVHSAVQESAAALTVSGNQVEQTQPEDGEGLG